MISAIIIQTGMSAMQRICSIEDMATAFASAFAYLANAVGFEAKVISSGGHGWAEIKGAVCDPNWAKGTGNIERYYRMSYDLSGVDGRPYYKGNRAYVITI